MRLFEYLEKWLPAGEQRFFGDVTLTRWRDTGVFVARHSKDVMNEVSESDLSRLHSPAEVREMTKFDSNGEYRPLKTAPTLRRGWLIREPDSESFYPLFDAIYPAAFATTVRYLQGEHDPVPLRTTLDRQTGMYRFAGNITDNQANQIMRDLCAPGCKRTIAWPIDDQCTVSRLEKTGRKIPLLCTEACTFAVTEARRLAREAYDKANAPE